MNADRPADHPREGAAVADDSQADLALEAEQLSVSFGSLKALDQVTLRLKKGEILGLIGPNGAGKTTLVNALSGFQAPTSGGVRMDGQLITGWSAQRRARAGLVRSFQAVRLFPGFSVMQNVEAGAIGAGDSPAAARARAEQLLSDFGLEQRADHPADGLPHGEERRVGILRALAARPAYLLLDEPAAGLNEEESDELGHLLEHLRDTYGCGLCLIEHDMRLVMGRCERIHVLAFGKTLAEGTPAEVRQDPVVIEAYLGDG